MIIYLADTYQLGGTGLTKKSQRDNNILYQEIHARAHAHIHTKSAHM